MFPAGGAVVQEVLDKEGNGRELARAGSEGRLGYSGLGWSSDCVPPVGASLKEEGHIGDSLKGSPYKGSLLEEGGKKLQPKELDQLYIFYRGLGYPSE